MIEVSVNPNKAGLSEGSFSSGGGGRGGGGPPFTFQEELI